MKRRDFILGASSSASILYLNPAQALAPCPQVFQGTTSNIPCPAVDAEADWLARIGGSGVVWYHDFRSDAEVDAFRWVGGIGNDPNDLGKPGTCIRNTNDGITGACLEIIHEVGTTNPAAWWRPNSPLDTGSGKTVDDPGAGGMIPAQPWDPSNAGMTQFYHLGRYAPASLHSQSPANFDGTEYYFQMRVKIDPDLTTQNSFPPGKTLYFTLTEKSLTGQEIVTESAQNINGVNMFSMYRSGSPPLESDSPGGGNQPGNELGFCDWPDTVSTCWSYSNDWDTLLYHIRPGGNGVSNTIVRVWAAHPGETQYTKIWDQDTVNLQYEENFLPGHNAVICSAYENNKSMNPSTYHRYCQLIFSKEFIPCPQF